MKRPSVPHRSLLILRDSCGVENATGCEEPELFGKVGSSPDLFKYKSRTILFHIRWPVYALGRSVSSQSLNLAQKVLEEIGDALSQNRFHPSSL